VIAIIDTGVHLQHEDLRDRLVGGFDFVDNDNFPQDENGHGTHVAGVAAATADNGVGVAGVAPAASIMPLRVLDRDGTGTESNVVQAIRFAVRQSKGLNLRLVVNLSLTDLKVTGSQGSSRLIQDAVREAWFAGAVIVAAAGNENFDQADYPAAGANVLSVGATDEQDRRASFSNRRPLVVAPGDKIVSTYWDPATPNEHAVYASGSGTSMAAPAVAGVAALLLSAGRTNAEAVARIVEEADDLGAEGADDEFGHGRVNAAAALGVPGAGRPRTAAAPRVPSRAPAQFEQVTQATPVPDLRAAGPLPEPAAGRGVLLIAAAALAAIAFAGAIWLRSGEAAAAAGTENPWEF
jgi:thermitase